MSEYPTAKESMKRGNLIHLNFLRKGITETHYYASVRSDGKFNLICMYSASEIGYMLLVLMKLVALLETSLETTSSSLYFLKLYARVSLTKRSALN